MIWNIGMALKGFVSIQKCGRETDGAAKLHEMKVDERYGIILVDSKKIQGHVHLGISKSSKVISNNARSSTVIPISIGCNSTSNFPTTKHTNLLHTQQWQIVPINLTIPIALVIPDRAHQEDKTTYTRARIANVPLIATITANQSARQTPTSGTYPTMPHASSLKTTMHIEICLRCILICRRERC